MKFSSSLVFIAAAATAVVAVPKPQAADGGHGVPPAATLSLSASASVSVSVSGPTPVAPSKPVDSGDESGGQHDIAIPFAPSNALFTLSPETKWATVEAPGVFNVTAPFATENADKAYAIFEPPQPFVAIDVWMYQRSTGGLINMLIDGVAVARLDYYNKTADPKDPPVKIYDGAKNKALKRAVHKVEFRNLVDARVKKAGQFNIDHVVITAAADAPSTAVQTTTPPSASNSQSQPPLTAPTTTPTTGEQASQQSEKPNNSALGLATPRTLLSALALVAAGFALL